MLSVILPVRNWPDERIAACARSFLRLKSATLHELLIIDFGSEQSVQNPVTDDRTRLIRAEADVWSLAEAINIGAFHARGAVLAKTDADILIAPEAGPALDRAVKAALKGSLGLALAQAIDLPYNVGVEEAYHAASHELDSVGRLRPRWGQGGLAIFTRSTWDVIGGFDSRFTGWGNEDNDFAERVRRSGSKVRWLDRHAVKIYHLWHPPSFHNKGIVARRVANVNLANRDRSVFRPLRILHSAPPREYRGKSLQHPSVVKRSAPLITIAIASVERKNRTRMLKEAIRSYIGQASNDMEIVVADNGSTAAEHARLCADLDKLHLPVRFTPIQIDDASIPAARNIITDAAAGRYICVADDDDIALPNRLADHLACFEKAPDVHGSHGGWIDFDELTGVIEANEGKERTLEILLFGTGKITAHPTCFYRTDVLRQIRYDENLPLGSDLDLALRMANAGLKVAHTHSYVTLRRFHAANVTVTGLSNQVTNGEKSRFRLQTVLGSALCDELAARAKACDQLAYCRNRIDPQRVIEMLPSYAGVWRLYFPLTALGKTTHAGNNGSSVIEEATRSPFELDVEVYPTATDFELPPGEESTDLSSVARVLEIVDGDVASIGSGINLGFAFISQPIRGASKALRAKRNLARLGVEAELIADQDLAERRQTGFAWSKLTVPKGARRLLSARISDPLAVTEALARLPAASVLCGMMSVISDGGAEGFRYYLVTEPLPGREAAASVAAALRRLCPVPFVAVANGGVACDF